MAEKATIMVLKVHLECPCCYKKVKKILCKFPQIRDQQYDEKGNNVTITVICCNPEKIRDKLCCKGAKVIKSIEIKDPPKPKKLEEHKETKKPEEPEKPIVIVIEKPHPPKTCCGPCSQGYGGGPCHYGYGVPPPPQPCYDGYYGYGCNGRLTHVSRCDYYFSEENPQRCSIM